MGLRKGISPIVATVLLILIAIATGIVIYAFAAGWVGTRFSEATGPQAILVVEKAYYDHGNKQFVLFVRNDGSMQANIIRAYITCPNGTITKLNIGNNPIEPGSVKEVTIHAEVTTGRMYTIKLISSDGAEVTVRVRA